MARVGTLAPGVFSRGYFAFGIGQLCELEGQISSLRRPRLGYFGARKPGLTHGSAGF